VRKVVSVAALVIAALGLVWLVRLTTRSPHVPDAAREAEATPQAQPEPVADSERPGVRPVKALGRIGGTLPRTLVDPRLLAEKSRRTLTVFSDGRPVKTYRIALGKSPVAPKEREGDKRTPEGTFYVCMKNPDSKYHLALGLSYPSTQDAKRGVEAGLISKREQRAIAEAVRHFRQPPWNTELGGEIMIHGGGAKTDWTTGCIALSEDDVEELYPLIPLGTEVEIRP
jgi:hypothetical protein